MDTRFGSQSSKLIFDNFLYHLTSEYKKNQLQITNDIALPYFIYFEH